MNRNQKIRNTIREQRIQLPEAYRRAASSRIAEQIVNLNEFQMAISIAMFLSMPGEVDLRPLIERTWGMEKNVFLPCVVGRGKPLVFREYSKSTQLNRSSFGIDEPNEQAKSIEPTQLDLVLVPLVAFDDRCNRLGMGAGFYDRTLASCDQTRFIGVAFEIQRVNEFEVQPHDVPMNAIVTESGVQRRE
ncbi:MAG: 5-formyltetrahydrofolate cyclo-ligase [Pirellulaceae bacterium]